MSLFPLVIHEVDLSLQFTDADGGVAQEFAQKLQSLSADNSKGELSIEKFLVKSEENFFDRVRKEKLSSAASYISSRRESFWSTPVITDEHDRPTSRSSLRLSWIRIHGRLQPLAPLL